MSTTPMSNVVQLFPREEDALTEPEVTPADLITIKMPKLNKNNTLADNDEEIEQGFHVEKAYVAEIVRMGRGDWEEFTNNLLEHREWLKERGGTSSLYNANGRTFDDFSQKEWEDWRNLSYNHVIEVVGPNRTIFVNPEGYDYARYVGVPYGEGDQERWEEREAAKKAEVKRQHQEAYRLKEEERKAITARGKIKYDTRPEWAKAAILAKLEEDISDLQSDCYDSRTVKILFLAWSKSTRDNFAEMRKAAAARPETAHLGPGKDKYRAFITLDEDMRFNGSYYHKGELSHWHGELQDQRGKYFTTLEDTEAFLKTAPQPEPIEFDSVPMHFSWHVSKESLENREKYSMGHGYWLGEHRYSGWQVRKHEASPYGENEICFALGNS